MLRASSFLKALATRPRVLFGRRLTARCYASRTYRLLHVSLSLKYCAGTRNVTPTPLGAADFLNDQVMLGDMAFGDRGNRLALTISYCAMRIGQY